MQKLIPVIYFYLLSLIGMVLIIIGVFNLTHYIVGVTAYEKYPLSYGEDRCLIQPMTQTDPTGEKMVDPAFSEEQCLEGLEAERQREKVKDLEESISFTVIGIIVFSSHFYFARKTHAHKI